MPYTDKVIDYIDAQLKATSLSDKRFASGNYFGLMQSMSLADNNFAPAKPDTNGEMKVAYPNDTNSIITYHRIGSLTYSNAKPAQFGDAKNSVVQSANMIMTVLAFSDQIKLSQSSLEGLIAPGIPSIMSPSPTDIQSVFLSLQSSRFDSQQIFNEEFKGVKYLLKPTMLLIQIKYLIEMQFKKNCFKICEC